MTLQQLHNEVLKLSNPERAKGFYKFFKTEKGEYGEGDEFVGLTVPQCRQIAKQFCDLNLQDLQKLISSKWHEERLIALIILVQKFQKGSEDEKKLIYDFYLKYTKHINNWDLVDVSADKIVGEYLYQSVKREALSVKKDSSPKAQNDDLYVLEKFAKSQNFWERRIAIISTFAFIRKGESSQTFEIAETLLYDQHDLIHKAVGWMLREVGKRCSREEEITFLNQHYKTMPRTMLRYAIEHFPEETRKAYLIGKI